MKIQREAVVTIEKLAFGGTGIGRIDGKVCFVPFVAVGDVVRVALLREKKSYYEAKLIEVVNPSPGRTIPPCPIFGDCGGCNWQHLPYGEQLRAKEDIFSETLARIARVGAECITEPIAAPDPFGYRSRVQLKVRFAGDRLHVGFYRQGSHYVIDCACFCAIARSEVNDLIARLVPLLKHFPEPDRIPQIDIATGDSEDAVIVFHYIGENTGRIVAWIKEHLGERIGATGIFMQCGRKSTMMKIWGSEWLSYGFSGDFPPGLSNLRLMFRAGGFSQVNYSQNHAMVAEALRLLDLTGNERVLDLYCGNGNFSLPVALCCRELVGVEGYSPSIDDAESNARNNGITNARFVCQDAEQWLALHAEAGENFDVVMLDPPRAGAREAVQYIQYLQPKKILYVSCDPTTLARDIATLQKTGFEVVACKPIDMFPQTYHLESLTLLCKR